MNHIIEPDEEMDEMDTQEEPTDHNMIFNSEEDPNTNSNDQITEGAQDTLEDSMADDDMTILNNEARSDGTFTFVLKDFSKLRETALSDPYTIRNLPWKIMIMQRPNHGQRSLGFFLQCNPDTQNSNWSCYASAQLTLCSQKPGIEDQSRRIQHLFYAKENDWGFSHFIGWNDVLEPERGYIKDDTLVFKAHVVADAPHGVSWDSKKHTGFVGLKNQGATCYMNSLLQTLYFTNQLRKAVYKMPTESDDSSKSVALALQRVFYDLQFSDKPVGTKRLTKSFGWEALDSFMQHDVQEFLRVLLDKLESKMKGTCVEGTVPKLFEGKMESFVKCKNVNYESKRTETFYDIQLNIKEKQNLRESFEDYVRTEMLDGDNKYDAGQHGLQDAEKGVIFQSFPPVLHLHLMRFHYDPITDCCVKYNERFEFQEKINLDSYLQSPGTTPADYTLHAVLVHSGDNHGGHYVVYINPKGDGAQWCKFDDDVVSRCSKQDALECNYGGLDDDLNVTVKHCTNAYMLVYIRDSELNNVLQNVSEKDIPSPLETRLADERRIELIRRKERNESHLYVNINVFLEDSFEGHQGTDLFELDHMNYKSIRIKRNADIDEIRKTLSETYKYSFDQLRVWPIQSRGHQTYRPTYLDLSFPKTVAELMGTNGVWNIYLETISLDQDAKSLPQFDCDQEVLVFFKLYDTKAKKIYYSGHMYIQSGSTLRALMAPLNQRAGYPTNTPLKFYEETKPHIVEPLLSLDEPLEKIIDEMTDGDIFVFQRCDKPYCDFPDCTEYFMELSNKIEVIFCDRTITNDSGFALEVSLKTKYCDLLEIISDRICVDKHRIQLFKTHRPAVTDIPSTPISHGFDGTVRQILNVSSTNCKKIPRRIFYQTHVIPLHELEHRRPVKVLFVGPTLKDEREITLYPIKNGKMSDLFEEATKSIELPPGGSGKLRVLELTSCRLIPCPPDETTIDSLSHRTLRIEEIPVDEVVLQEDEYLIPVAHFNKDIFQTFGTPFLLKLKDKESFADVRQRICEKIGVTEKELEKYKFTAVIMGRPKEIPDDPEALVEISLFRLNNNCSALQKPWLGLEHANKTPKRSRFSYLEKSIKIYN